MVIGVLKDFLENTISYTTWSYFLLLGFCVIFYYSVPKRGRWAVLLIGSIIFYELAGRGGEEWTFYLFLKDGYFYYLGISKTLVLFYLSVIVSYTGGLALQKRKSKILYIIFVLVSVLPLFFIKVYGFLRGLLPVSIGWIVAPLGLSFYSLQEYAYLTDVYKNRTENQRNPFKYLLFISFFPQIMQGPIPRYNQLKEELFIGHHFDYDYFAKGFMLILWGFFLKYMIAERASVVVNLLFDEYMMYQGAFSLVAGVLYSFQLYTDFLACVCMCRGAAQLFGITMIDNFDRPYFAVSIKDFWRRWHISLSSWLRDYVYIPLGGSRKGRLRKNLNLLATFLVSGIWHGNGIQFVVWGLLHAIYQIMGDYLRPIRIKVKQLLGIENGSTAEKAIARCITFMLVMFAWILFRADTLKAGYSMIRSIFSVYNPWIFFDDSLLTLGLDWKEWMLLITSIYVLFRVEFLQEKIQIRDAVLKQPLFVRWFLYLIGAAVVIIFGKYGYGFNATDFIYRGF